MVLIKSKPEQIFRESVFPQSFNSLMNAFFEEPVKTGVAEKYEFMPASDIVEHESAFEIRISLPGMQKEDIKISLDGDRLTVSGERSQNLSAESSRFMKREITYGRFSRTYTLGKTDTSGIEAKYENGLLMLHIPKQSAEKPALIPVK